MAPTTDGNTNDTGNEFASREEVRVQLSEVWADVKSSTNKLSNMEGVLGEVAKSVDNISKNQVEMGLTLARIDEREKIKKTFSAKVLGAFTTIAAIIGAVVGGFFTSKGG